VKIEQPPTAHPVMPATPTLGRLGNYIRISHLTPAAVAGYTFNLSNTTRLDLRARVNNLANCHYSGSVIVNDGNGRYFEPGPDLSVMLGARLTF
jgi:hypothetical protein